MKGNLVLVSVFLLFSALEIKSNFTHILTGQNSLVGEIEVFILSLSFIEFLLLELMDSAHIVMLGIFLNYKVTEITLNVRE